ncbi:MAG TPA: DUF2117 domain-containing protein [Methanoregulaceae archaeon]|nr:DUF2117 domain-containing protein [Methanoregulaceae archaeon]
MWCGKPVVMVVHGPEIFDLGFVHRLKDAVRPDRIVVAGVMARTAAEESKILVEYAEVVPSVAIRTAEEGAFLANYGKTPESGKIFGEIIAGRLGNRGLIQVECSDRVIYRWNGGDASLAAHLSERTGYRTEHVITKWEEPAPGIRAIRGCIPGEPVFVNGYVIGYATGITSVISIKEGRVTPVSGIRLKPHGIEKLQRTGPLDPGNLWCKSGIVRHNRPVPAMRARKKPGPGRIVTIDHSGFEIYRYLGEDVCGILAIGDDTTAICGHICAHLGIPVFGITDGDEDHIVSGTFAPGSVVMLVTRGTDDDIGRELSSQAGHLPVWWESWVTAQIERIGDRGHVITRVPP